ncbi:MAG TPA: GAP family protein [Streptosporangiaceae bacterium]|nr:GAP family protein [Streptosporangiaceae bacterium]
MLATAAGLALLAALSPAAILVCAVYLGSVSPRRITLVFLAGAITMTVVMGVIVLVALRAGGMSLASNRTPRYGLRLGLGVLALASGVFMALRKPKPPDPDKKKKPSLMTRMMARPGALAAFATGIIVFVPSASFVAAVQVIATAHASTLASALTLTVVVLINVMFVWLPFGFHLIAPDATTRGLKAFNGWLRVHGHAMVAGALTVAGVALILDGVSGLA